jgi:GT2 family glycosyltransferase
MNAQVGIVILNWNNASDTIECLASFRRLDYPNYHILVVDNGSTDGSVGRIQAEHPEIEIIETGENLGYAGGNNAGIRQALAQGVEYICILNNDVTVAPDFLSRLLYVLGENVAAGVATPLVAEMANPDRVWSLGMMVDGRTATGTRLHAGERLRDWQVDESDEVDVASGAAMLVKRQVFERVGLLDEAFYLYYEETDWCLHARRAGYRIVAVPSSVVWHKVSATLGSTSPVIDYYMLRNHLRLISRHWSGVSRLWLLTRTVLRDLITIAAYTAKPHSGKRLPHRNARLMALRDAILGRWGKMGPDVEAVCYPDSQ